MFIVRGKVLLVALLLVTTIFLFKVRSVLPPFVFAFIVAYLVNPLVAKVSRLGMKRSFVSAIFTFFLTGFVVAFFSIVIPFVLRRALDVMKSVDLVFIEEKIRNYVKNLASGDFGYASNFLQDMFKTIIDVSYDGLKNIGYGVLKSIVNGFDNLPVVLLTPVVLFYMIKDWDQIVSAISSLIPRRYSVMFSHIIADIDIGVSRYLRGQIRLCVLLSIFYSVLLLFTPIKLPLLFGFIIGVSTFVPYFGFFISAGVTIIIALHEFGGDFHSIMKVLSVLLIGQVFDAGFLSPRIMGDSLNLSPLWMMFGVLVCSVLFGISGAFFAVPIVVIFVVVFGKIIQVYKKTPMYTASR